MAEEKSPKEQAQKSALFGLKKAFSKPIQFVRTHRLLSILVGSGLLVAIVFLILFSGGFFAGIFEIGTHQDAEQQKKDLEGLSVIIPPNAFPHAKSFTIQTIPQSSPKLQSLKLIAGYTGTVYEVKPTDGRKDLAMVPLTFRYTLPAEYYFGPEYNNFEMVYVEDLDVPVARTYYGSVMRDIGGNVVLEASVFDPGAVMGIRVNVPERKEFAMRKSIEKPDSLKPDILVIPGTDSNFLGVLPNTITNTNPQGNNIWEITFPDRSIWVFDYPLLETQTMQHAQESDAFFQTAPFRSYALYEAHRLASYLNQTSRSFDIVAHGLGGIIARLAVEYYNAQNVRKLVLISTPNAGTNIVNPLLMNQIHGKDPRALSGIFGVSEAAIRFLQRNNLGYMEKVNRFYLDLLPDSRIVEILEGSLRNDLEYLFVAGDDPGFAMDLGQSQLSRFFPENTPSKGDGIISVYSAIYPHLNLNQADETHRVYSHVFPHSFSDLYIQNDTLSLVQRFLEEGIEVVEIPTYFDDSFREWAFDITGWETFGSTPTGVEDLSWISLPTTPTADHVATVSPTRVEDPASSPLDDWKTEHETIATQTAISDPKPENDYAPDDPSPGPESDPADRVPSRQVDLQRFVPTTPLWRGIVLPEAFFQTGTLIRYSHAQVQVPDGIRPFGLITHQSRIYLLTLSGTMVWERGNWRSFSPTIPQAHFRNHPTLTLVMDDVILSIREETVRESLGVPGSIQSVAVNDSIRYFLVQSNGLILETPFSSFSVPGTRGKLILHGMYPFVVTDVGIYLFDGKELRAIIQSGPDYRILDAVLADTSLFFITNHFTLHRVSLDGALQESTSISNVGGFKLLAMQDYVLVIGRSRINVIDLAPKPPVGSYFSVEPGTTIVDADLWEGGLLLLIRNDDGFYLEKVGVVKQ